MLVGWGAYKYDERRFLADGVLKIDSLPWSLSIEDRYTVAWTDYHEEYLLSIDPASFKYLLSGRNYETCDIERFGKGEYTNFNGDVKFESAECYSSGNWQSHSGSTTVYSDASRHLVVVIYNSE